MLETVKKGLIKRIIYSNMKLKKLYLFKYNNLFGLKKTCGKQQKVKLPGFCNDFVTINMI